MATFYRASKSSKIKRSVDRIVEHVDKLPLAKRDSILERISTIMTRECFSKNQSAKEALQFRNLQLGNALAKQALDTGDIDFICRNFADIQMTDMGRMFLASRFFAYIGSSTDRSLEFCQILFSFYARQEERGLDSLNENDLMDQTAHLVGQIISTSVNAPAIEECPQKRWIINLVGAGSMGNTKALECLAGIMDYCSSLISLATTGEVSGMQTVPIISQSELDTMIPNKVQQIAFSAMIGPGELRMVLPDHLMVKIQRISEQVAKRDERNIAETAQLLQWFQDHASALGQKFDEKCEAIRLRPRYGVRPMGYDSFLVDVSPLRTVGVTSFSFYPEGEQFPNMKIMVTVRKSNCGPVLCQYWIYLRNFELTTADGVLLNWQGLETSILRGLLEYIVVHALHRIVVGQPTKNLDNHDIDRPEHVRDVTPDRSVKVRPFIRRLRWGFQASEEARQLAFLHLGWNLPDGMTFVRSHDRWIGLPAGKPTPLFEYTDEAIKESLA